MSKKMIAALAGVGLIAGVTVHSYLDIMYRESIPKGPFKRLQEALDNGDMDALHDMCVKSNEWNDRQPKETITIVNGRGQNLKGFLIRAEEESNVYVVFAHGYRADHRGDPANFVKYYHDKGYHFFACDHTCSGESEGDFVGFDYFESADTLMWIDYLIDRFGKDIKIILHGVSMGGATVCKMADKVPEQVKLIVADCPYTSAKEEFLSVAGSVGVKKTAPVLFTVINEMNKRLAKYDLMDTDVRDSVIHSKVPMLFIHGGADDFVPTKMGLELYDLCEQEKDLFICDQAKHAESIVQDTQGYLTKLDEFIDKYL